MSEGKPKGMLMTGGIGSILQVLCWAIFFTMIAALFAMISGGGAGAEAASEDNAAALGGIMLLALLFLFIGSIMQGVGFFGLKKLFGGTFGLAGWMDILVAIGMVLLIVAGVMQSVGLMKGAGYVFFFALFLTGLFGGLAMLGAKGKAEKGGGPLMIGGLLFVIGGAAVLALFLLGTFQINVGETVGTILGYAGVGGLFLGHLMATVVMFGQRS